jgi:hypothetical protein
MFAVLSSRFSFPSLMFVGLGAAVLADLEDVFGHAPGIAEEVDFAAGLFMPVDWDFDDWGSVIEKMDEEIDIEGEAENGEFVLNGVEGWCGDEFETALGIVNGDVQAFGDEGGVDATEEVALELAIDDPAKHFDAGGEEGG